jgi:hypothetical protein
MVTGDVLGAVERRRTQFPIPSVHDAAFDTIQLISEATPGSLLCLRRLSRAGVLEPEIVPVFRSGASVL